MLTHPDFIQIPCQLLIDEALQPSDRILYGYIYWLQYLKNEKCTASNPTFASLMKIDAGSVQNSLNRLEERGYIERVYKDPARRVRLEIRALVAFKHVSSKNGTKRRVSSNDGTVSSNNDTQVSSNDDQNKSIINKNSKEELATPQRCNIQPLLELFKEVNPSWERLYSNKTERAALTRLVEKYGADTIGKWTQALPKIIAQPYAPQITTPYQLERKLGQLMSFLQRKKSEKPISAKL
jgi:hypothetical protein